MVATLSVPSSGEHHWPRGISEVLPDFQSAVHPLEQDITQNITDQYPNECKMILKIGSR